MAIGSFKVRYNAQALQNAQSENTAPKEPTQRKFKNFDATVQQKDFTALETTTLNILVVGRTLKNVKDFICSVNINMTQAMSDEGMSYFTSDPDTSLGIFDTKRKIERYFWEFSKNNLNAPEKEENPLSECVYTFSICPSANQSRLVNLIFHCAEYTHPTSVQTGNMDAVWYLADGAAIDTKLATDSFRSYIVNALNTPAYVPDGGAAPVKLLVVQAESCAHFDKTGKREQISSREEGKLKEAVRSTFPSFEGKLPYVPVQIYGGIAYVGMGEDGVPDVRLCSSGYYQSYIPVFCQMPVLYTMEKVLQSLGKNLFPELPSGGLLGSIGHHYYGVTGNGRWSPDTL